VAITVEELVAIPYLRTWLHAGAGGASRTIGWAHSCEVPNPWDWFDEGDLLMTNGFSLPADADGQVDFLLQLAETGLSGVAIGEGQAAPPLTETMLSRAEELQFPILFTAYEVPFIAISRVVAEANQHEEQRRLVRTVRLYDRLREWMVNDRDSSVLIEKLAKELRCRLYVLDGRRANGVLPGLTPPPDEVAEAVRRDLAGRDGPRPALTRIAVGRSTALVVPVPSRRPTVLVVSPGRGSRPDLALLQHAATIAALQVERITAEREQARRLGAELLGHLVDGTLEAGSAAQQLDTCGLGGEQLVLAACGNDGVATGGELHHRLTELGVAHLLLPRDSCLFVLMQGSPADLDALRKELDSGVSIGVSDPFHTVSRAPDAAREAQWALQAARAGGGELVRYGENSPLFLPRTLSQAQAAVTRVIGPLLDYDRDHGTELVDSLRVFLNCNRSWQRAAKELFVHKQTLVYRMRRVEELAGRRLDCTADVAELWLALQAQELRLGTPPSEPAGTPTGA
jgi:PucR family transcriptional regulator, purine catabolism regulatory protein